MSRGPTVDALLLRALTAMALADGCCVEPLASESRQWASATFVGARHRITLAGTAGAALDRWLGGLPEAEFSLRGHLVADLSVVETTRAGDAVTATVEVLTLEEG